MLTVATLLWEPNAKTLPFSRCYDETWVEKLYRGFKRNLTQPFRLVCYTDRDRTFAEPVEQVRMKSARPGYGDCIQPYEMGVPMVLVGLDTIVTGNVDHLAGYCFSATAIGLPRDPYKLDRACNGVALVPGGLRSVWDSWRGENDMAHMRTQPHAFIDDLFPGHVQSFKGAIRDNGLADTRIVYFHGPEKPHERGMPAWVAEHWR